jgi:uncharacterized membrane protein HdeD (DUF308 family)
MIRLAILLLGAEATRRKWRSMVCFGVLWISLGVMIMADGVDGVTVLATESFAYFLLAEGVVAVFLTLAFPGYRRRFFLARAVALLVLGLMIIDSPWHSHIATSILFGSAFLVDGAIRVTAALMLRYARWWVVLAGACLELTFAALLFSGLANYHMTVPLSIGLAMCLTGFIIERLALQLRQLPDGATVTTLPLFAHQHWFDRSDAPPYHRAGLEETASRLPLTVRIWTPAGSIDDARARPLVDRYIAAVDRAGAVSIGHAALQLAPDIYISHYPAEEVEHSTAEFTQKLRATKENDRDGLFQPSYEAEVASWREADQRVKFRHFNAAQLRVFWESYRRDDTYNLTNRNCAVAVALALDAALEGTLRGRGVWLRFLRLLGVGSHGQPCRKAIAGQADAAIVLGQPWAA